MGNTPNGRPNRQTDTANTINDNCTNLIRDNWPPIHYSWLRKTHKSHFLHHDRKGITCNDPIFCVVPHTPALWLCFFFCNPSKYPRCGKTIWFAIVGVIIWFNSLLKASCAFCIPLQSLSYLLQSVLLLDCWLGWLGFFHHLPLFHAALKHFWLFPMSLLQVKNIVQEIDEDGVWRKRTKKHTQAHGERKHSWRV